MANDKWVLVSKSKLNALAKKIKFVLGIKENLTLDEMNEQINLISTATSEVYQILSGNIVNYTNSTLNILRPYSFSNCISLATINLPNVMNAGVSSFQNCTKLKSAYLKSLYSIPSQCFYRTLVLEDLYLGYKGIVSLTSTQCFSYSGSNANGYVRVHVRPEYVSEYENAKNWVDLINSGQIVIVGDYVDE